MEEKRRCSISDCSFVVATNNVAKLATKFGVQKAPSFGKYYLSHIDWSGWNNLWRFCSNRRGRFIGYCIAASDEHITAKENDVSDRKRAVWLWLMTRDSADITAGSRNPTRQFAFRYWNWNRLLSNAAIQLLLAHCPYRKVFTTYIERSLNFRGRAANLVFISLFYSVIVCKPLLVMRTSV